MTHDGLLIVGSGPAGVGAAEVFRQHDHRLPVTIVTGDPDPPYARPPLSKDFLRGQTDDVKLHPAQWYTDRDIDIRHVGGVGSIDTAAHELTAGGVTWRYRALVLACGAAPTPLPVTGAGNALALRSLADARRLRQHSAGTGSAAVIGAGFIGCEAAASLAIRGLDVTIVSPEPIPHAERLGEAAGREVLAMLEGVGVRYRGGTEVVCVEAGAVHLEDGARIPADVILAATGVRPNSALAASAGITVSDGRIAVGSDMRTSAPDVYAAGDVALAHNTTAGRALAVEHWQDAVDQGRIAGANAAGSTQRWSGVPGFWSTIGARTIKYHAWGDGYDDSRMVHSDKGFTVWYHRGGTLVGVLTCDADDDYERGGTLIAEAAGTRR